MADLKIILLFSQLTNLQHSPSIIELPPQHFGYVAANCCRVIIVLLSLNCRI